MKICALLFSGFFAASALAEQVRTESPPVAKAADLLPTGIAASGTDYTIDPDVPTDGFAGLFVLRTAFGDYQCEGREMLFTRMRELRALEEIDRVSKTGAFAKAITQGVAGDEVEAVVKIAKNPAGSVEQAPLGAVRLVGKVLGGFASFGETVGKAASLGKKENGPKPPPSREDPIGYNEARSEWARKFGVDPYTTNRPLALKLNHLGMISFSVDKVAGAGAGVVEGGLGPLVDYLSYLPDVDEHLLTKPPADITKYNAKRLADAGVSKQEAAPLLENDWFSPPQQTRLVNTLLKMKDATHPAAIVGLAANVESEEQARFVCASAELLARNLDALPPPRELRAYSGVAAATGADGTLLVAVPVDLLSWTDTVAKFAVQKDPAVPHAILCINGPLTKRAQAGLAATGWQLRQVQK